MNVIHQVSQASEYCTKLRKDMIDCFSSDELRTLCSDSNVDYDSLPGDGKEAKVRELIGYLARRNQISILITKCAEVRPNTSRIWNNNDFESFVNSSDTEQRLLCLGSLYEHITIAKPVQPDFKSNWEFLEEILVRAVIAGGVAGMTYYRPRGELPQPFELAQEAKEKNPSTWADLLATARILETLNSVLPAITQPYKLDCMLSYLGEETKFTSWFKEHGVDSIPERVLMARDFFSPNREHNRLRVIVDGIDGTGSFMRGIPIFCSAAAILVEDEPRVSAIYDPIHHIVYSALLLGPYGEPEKQTKARAWEVSTGNRVDLVEFAREREKKRPERQLRREALGIHLTRTYQDRLPEFLRGTTECPPSMLERLAQASGAIYALNSGIFAMVEVATGSLGGFVNNVTHLWDVAAGEVLVRACGGRVTTFDRNLMKYSSDHKPSIIAADKHLHSKILDIVRPTI